LTIVIYLFVCLCVSSVHKKTVGKIYKIFGRNKQQSVRVWSDADAEYCVK